MTNTVHILNCLHRTGRQGFPELAPELKYFRTAFDHKTAKVRPPSAGLQLLSVGLCRRTGSLCRILASTRCVLALYCLLCLNFAGFCPEGARRGRCGGQAH